jgi:hypothetical protein
VNVSCSSSVLATHHAFSRDGVSTSSTEYDVGKAMWPMSPSCSVRQFQQPPSASSKTAGFTATMPVLRWSADTVTRPSWRHWSWTCKQHESRLSCAVYSASAGVHQHYRHYLSPTSQQPARPRATSVNTWYHRHLTDSIPTPPAAAS